MRRVQTGHRSVYRHSFPFFLRTLLTRYHKAALPLISKTSFSLPAAAILSTWPILPRGVLTAWLRRITRGNLLPFVWNPKRPRIQILYRFAVRMSSSCTAGLFSPCFSAMCSRAFACSNHSFHVISTSTIKILVVFRYFLIGNYKQCSCAIIEPKNIVYLLNNPGFNRMRCIKRRRAWKS